MNNPSANRDLLLRAKIGLSAGRSMPNDASIKTESGGPEPAFQDDDVAETEYAQIMRIKVNEKYDELME